MHGAPSVSHPVARSSWAAAIVAAIWASAAAVTAAWVAAGAAGWHAALAIVLLAAWGAFAAVAWWRSAPGMLAWDGMRWTWMPDGAATARDGSLAVVLDLQRVVLVCWREAGDRRWFWLQQHGSRSSWDALRRAVYSRAVADAPSGAQPPSATP